MKTIQQKVCLEKANKNKKEIHEKLTMCWKKEKEKMSWKLDAVCMVTSFINHKTERFSRAEVCADNYDSEEDNFIGIRWTM